MLSFQTHITFVKTLFLLIFSTTKSLGNNLSKIVVKKNIYKKLNKIIKCFIFSIIWILFTKIFFN